MGDVQLPHLGGVTVLPRARLAVAGLPGGHLGGVGGLAGGHLGGAGAGLPGSSMHLQRITVKSQYNFVH